MFVMRTISSKENIPFKWLASSGPLLPTTVPLAPHVRYCRHPIDRCSHGWGDSSHGSALVIDTARVLGVLTGRVTRQYRKGCDYQAAGVPGLQ